jgi:uncharacterized protein YraI
MRVKIMTCTAAVFAGGVVPGAALAASMAVATVDLNIRSGPGPEFPIVGAISANDRASIEGCIQGSRWCQVSYRGKSGWAYTEYMQLAGGAAPGTTVTTTRRTIEPGRTTVTTTTEHTANAFGVPTVVYERPATVSVAPEVSGTVIDAAPAPRVITAETRLPPPGFVPPPDVDTYVVSHPLDPTYLHGEVVVGAGLPASVALRPVPNYEYGYAYVNRQPVLVEPSTRRIVYVYR